MNSLLTDAEIDRLIDEAQALQVAEWGSPTLHAALVELQKHRQDARARRVLPLFVPGQPGEGEMVDALTTLTDKNAMLDARERAHELLRSLLFEVLHLRRQVTHVQMVATNERDLRCRADRERMDAVADRDNLLGRLRELSRRKPEPTVITRMPIPDPPADQRSKVWQEASKRIDEAVDAGRDPDPADVDIAMREKLKSAGFDDPEMLDEMIPPPKSPS